MQSIVVALRMSTPLMKNGWGRVPVNRLVNNPHMRGFAARAIWLVLPLQYYVLTSFNGGFLQGSYLAAAAVTIVDVAMIIAFSSAVAYVWRRDITYQVRARSLTISMLMVWGVALALLFLSYFVTAQFKDPRDVIGRVVTNEWPPQGGHPDICWQTLLTYFVYCLIASGLVSLALRVGSDRFGIDVEQGHSRKLPEKYAGPDQAAGAIRLPEPSIFAVAVLTGIAMMVLNRGALVQSWGELVTMFLP